MACDDGPGQARGYMRRCPGQARREMRRLPAMLRLPVRWVLLAVLLLPATSCTSSKLERLDARAAAMIRERQREALGRDPTDADTLIPDLTSADPGRSAYRHRPDTFSPPAEALPVEPAGDEVSLDTVPALSAVGDAALQLDLEDLLQIALATGPEYQSEKEELFLDALSLIAERHLWGPRFFDVMTASVSGTPESGDNDLAFNLINEFGVTQRLPYGGQIAATALVGYVNFLRQRNTAFEQGTPIETQNFDLGVSIDLPLLRGAGVVAREDLIQTERNLIYGVRDFERFRREFLVDISTTYFNLISRARQIENRKRQLESFERLADRYAALAEAGQEPYFAAERALQRVLFARNNLLNAEQSYVDQLDSFKLVLGVPTQRDVVIVPVEVVIPEPALEPQAAVAMAMASRLELQTAEDRVEDAARQVKVAKNRLLPDLDVFADLNLGTADDAEIGGVDLDLGSSDYTAGARLALPLDRKLELVAYRRSLIGLERQARDTRLFRDRIVLQVRQAIRDVQQARFSLRLQEQNVQIAERRVIGVRLRERTLGPRDVIEAEEDLLEARNRRDLAVANLQQSILNFLLATGQMRVGPDGQWQPPGRLMEGADAVGDADAIEQPDGIDINDPNMQLGPLDVGEVAAPAAE